MLGERRRSCSWPAAFMAMVTLILVLGACGGSKEPAVAAETTIGSVSTERGSDPIVEDVVALREASDNEPAAQALRDLHTLLRRAFNQGAAKGSAILRTEAPPLVETFAKAASDVRAKVLGLRLQTESAEVLRAIEVETLDGEVRIYEAFAARLEKGDSAWVASDRLRTQEQALLQELRTRFQPMINRLPRKDRETLASAMAEIFGLGS
jgi:hypothetical protein